MTPEGEGGVVLNLLDQEFKKTVHILLSSDIKKFSPEFFLYPLISDAIYRGCDCDCFSEEEKNRAWVLILESM